MISDPAQARHRLRRFQSLAAARHAFDGLRLDLRTTPDTDRLAAPFLERIGPRERGQLLLWASAALVLALSLVSFFSAPLMDPELASGAVAVLTMLVLSYVI